MEPYKSFTYASNRDDVHVTFAELKPTLPNQVTIKVQAASLNPSDVILYNSAYGVTSYLNNKQGIGRDYAGVVESIGTDAAAASGLEIGDHVCGMYVHPFGDGTITEYLQLDPKTDSAISKIPDSWDFTQAAAIPLVYGTAHSMMENQQLKGAKVLILGGATSVGRYLVQLAKLYGATTVVTTNGTKSNELVRTLGLTHQIDYHQYPNILNPVLELAKDGRFNYIYDCAGTADLFSEMTNILDSEKNEYVSIVGDRHYNYSQDHLFSLSWPTVKSILRSVWLKVGKLGYNYRFVAVAPGKWLEEGVKLVDEGKIKVFIDKVYGFNDTPQALAALRTGALLGKVVVNVAEE